jgi:hypothetical protein
VVLKLIRTVLTSLAGSIDALKGKLQALSDLGLSKDDLNVVLTKQPFIWRASSSRILETGRRYREQFAFTIEELRAIVLKRPHVLLLPMVC